jgi:GH43 family beta-xylosidase
MALTATPAVAAPHHSLPRAHAPLVQSPNADTEQAARDFDLGVTTAWKDLRLANSFEGTKVTWSSSRPGTLRKNGTVTRGSKARKVTLTATFSKDRAATRKKFPVTVLPRDAGTLFSYTTKGSTKRTDVLHLATATTHGSPQQANQAAPVLYTTTGSARMGSPTVFRDPDGGFRLLAPEIDGDSRTGKAYVFSSKDLVHYTDEELVDLAPGKQPTDLSVDYDNAASTYTVTYTDAATDERQFVTSTDLRKFSTPETSSKVGNQAAKGSNGGLPNDALDVASVPVTSSELSYVRSKLGRVHNTAVKVPGLVTTKAGSERPGLPATAEATYSSGSTSKFPVRWDQNDLAAVNTNKPGVYTVNGTVKNPTYPDPLVERRADPDVTKGDDGYYYFTSSYPMTRKDDPDGYDRVILRRSKTIAGLKDAQEVSIWDEDSTPDVNRYIWAPELNKIGDDWYILFTGARNGGPFDIRPYMLKFTGEEFTGDAVMNKDNWKLVGPVKAHAGDEHAFTSFSLDMTAFESNGKHYLVWAEKPGSSTLRMAQIDPKDPTQLIGDSVQLSEPTQAWEQNDAQNLKVDEGPAVIRHDGKVYVSFSGSSVDRNYAVGLLAADESSDLMDPKSWTKTGYPVLTTDDVPGQMGPGHNSFTTDEYGNPVIVFHSRTENDSSNPGEATDEGLFDPRRHARAKTVHFDVDGDPVFNMTAAEELDPRLARVSVKVVVRRR